MRALLILVPTILAASPALAAPPQARQAPPPMAQPPIAIPPALSDPAMADQIGRVAGVLTKTLMNLPVGEMEAAIEGRVPTPADRARTVRDESGDPYLDQRVAAEAAATGRTMQAAGKALVGSLPAIMQALSGARAEIERAVGNLPDPGYPRR